MDSPEPALISVIMPCYNARMHLHSGIGSVLAQTFINWELIAIDDGSFDDTLVGLQSQTDVRIRTLSQTNQGVSSARNAGLAVARGRYVAFLDVDDTWDPQFLEKMLAPLQTCPGAVMAYCGWQNIGQSGRSTEPFVPPDYENAHKLEALLTGCRWPIHAVLVRLENVMAVNGFDPALKNAEDFSLWLNVATTGPIVRVPEVLAYYHFHGVRQSSNEHARAAVHHWEAQLKFLESHPELRAELGPARIRELTPGELLKKGYSRYWRRDLSAARKIFRTVMKQGYGKLRDWKYMLPAWLPESWHRWLIGLRDRDAQTTNAQL